MSEATSDAAKNAPATDGQRASPTDDNGRAERRAAREQRSLVNRTIDAVNEALYGANSKKTVSLYTARVLVQVFRQWARDRCPQQAAQLAFQTILSIVPLIALAMAIVRGTGTASAESSLVRFISEAYIPVSREAISNTLLTWTSNISFRTLGLAGLVFTLMLAFVMFNTIERIMNDIWRAEKRRSLPRKFAVFYLVVTIIPALLAIGVYQASKVGLTSGMAGAVVSILFSFSAALFVIYLLPSTVVHLRAAAAGAAVTSLTFELAKFAFATYVEEVAFSRFSGIYGTVALAPLFLLWVYYAWLVVLLGVEVAYAAQHLHLLEQRNRSGVMSLENELARRVNGPVGARVMTAVAEAYLAGRKVLSRRALSDRYDLSDEVIERLVSRLKDADLLIEVEGEYTGLMPARPPQEIALADVLGAFRGDDVTDLSHASGGVLDDVLRDIDAHARKRADGISIAHLIASSKAPAADS